MWGNAARHTITHNSHYNNSDSLENSSGTTPSDASGDVRSVENALKALWERVRRAGDLIQQLREERQALHTQVEQLRTEVQHLQNELSRKEQILGSMPPHREGDAARVFGNGEREALVQKVKDLLARIDAYL
jgi:chromosome segregation ATPase